MATVTDTAAGVNLESAVVILQLFDSSVYLVNKSDGEKRLPRKDRHGTYHIEGSLVVADKATVKELVQQLVPLLKLLGNSRKILLTPLARYWVAPCCANVEHHTNYNTRSYLSALGDAVHVLRDHIRDCLFTRRIPNFRILCPNRMIGVGQRRQVPSDEEAAKAAALWGNNPVHPTAAAYRCMADCLMSDIQNKEAKYTNPSRPTGTLTRPKIDLSQERDNWVTGCSAAAPRRDIDTQHAHSGKGGSSQRHQNRGTNHPMRGSVRGFTGRSSVASSRGSRGGSRGGYGRRVWGRGRWGSF
jgi:hypothetical protein